MIIDTVKANTLLNRSGISRTNTTANAEELFKEIVKVLFYREYDESDVTDESALDELWDLPIKFEMKDLNFSVYKEEGDTLLQVSVKCMPEWDDHIEVVELESNPDWEDYMEQMWEYTGTKSISELKAEFIAMGAIFDKELEDMY